MGELTEDQVEAVGLLPGRGYQVTGMLLDAEGEPVELPRVGALTVLIRWLHPMDTPVFPGYHDASLRGSCPGGSRSTFGEAGTGPKQTKADARPERTADASDVVQESE
ncbi:hypothetical protein ACKI19_42060 [Streptomyces caniscabiei]|uniref:hypothetical protein n=1 Tax=Streptomyces caniscabiei TaxID=2746961 RepID=UPI0038F76CC3